MPEFSGAVALVTGGGRGMGAAICEKLAEYGATVVATDANGDAAAETSERILAAGGAAHAFPLDVTSLERARSVAEEVEQAIGPIQVLVNNAAVSSFTPFLSLDEVEFDRIFAVNVRGVFNLCKAVVPRMVERRSGRVVNIASIVGKQGEPNIVHYASSKFAVVGFTQSLATEMGEYGITVNSVCPGIVETPLWTEQLYREAVDTEWFPSADDLREYLVGRIPLHRLQPAEDIAEMVAFLASDLGRNMTGGSYHVDGGMVMR